MRTALLLSGLPRHVEAGHQSIVDSLIKPNRPDVFIHTWGNPHDHLLHNKLTKLFHPKHIMIEPARKIYNEHMDLERMMESHGRSYTRPKFVEMVYSMWLSLLQANMLKEQCRLEHNIKYDCVIRARFDITYTGDVDVKNYDMNVLNVADRIDLPVEMIDDRFAFASNEVMNLYCGGYAMLDHIHAIRHKLDGIFCGETVLYEICKIFNIEHKIMSGFNANHLR